MTVIQVDSYVRVPRGTVVFPIGDGAPAPTARDQVVKVKRIFDVDVTSDNFYLLLPDELRTRYFETSGAKGSLAPDILEFADRLTRGDYRAVEWSSKWALIAEVQPAEARARATKVTKVTKADERPATKQDLMTRGSVWRFTHDAELRYKVRNPAYANVREEILNSLRQLPSHARTLAVEAKLNELGLRDYLDEPWGSVQAGETFTVINKLTKGYAGGLDVPTRFRGERFTLPYSSLEPVIEFVSAA